MVMSAPMREGNRLEDLKPAGVVMNQPVIETERFVLRPLRPSDAGMIAHYTSDRRVAQGTRAIPHPLPPGAVEAYVVAEAEGLEEIEINPLLCTPSDAVAADALIRRKDMLR